MPLDITQEIIKFYKITDHKDETIGKALEASIKEWSLTRVVTVTVDNASSNDVALEHLKTYVACEMCGTYSESDCQ